MTRKELEEKRLRRMNFCCLFSVFSFFVGVALVIIDITVEIDVLLYSGIILSFLSIIFFIILCKNIKEKRELIKTICPECDELFSFRIIKTSREDAGVAGTGGIASYILFFIPNFLSSHNKLIRETKYFKCTKCGHGTSSQEVSREIDLKN